MKTVPSLFVAIAIAGLLFTGISCKPVPPPKAIDLQESVKKKPVKTTIDVGDVEVSIALEAVLAEKSNSSTVSEERLVDSMDHLNVVTVSVSPPVPNELWIQYALVPKRPFPECVAALRVQVFRDEDVIGSFEAVLDSPDDVDNVQYAVDAFSGLSSPPDTMLIHARGELILLPKGTDPATVDPRTATGPAIDIGSIISNPLRVELTDTASSE